jgi:hypothetical protein
MEAGHHPMAIVAMNRHGARLVVAAMPLVEVEKMPNIGDYLAELVRHHKRVLAEDGVAQGPRPN